MQSNADRELELEGADCEEKIGMMQRLQGSEGGDTEIWQERGEGEKG